MLSGTFLTRLKRKRLLSTFLYTKIEIAVILLSDSIERTVPEEIAQKYKRKKENVTMIKVHYNGETYDMPNAGPEEIRDLLKEHLPEISDADYTVDDSGNITFRTKSKEKGA